MPELTNREFADEFFRVIEDGQFSEEALDFVDALSHRLNKQPMGDDYLTENCINLMRAFYKIYDGDSVTLKEIAEAQGMTNARGLGGVISSIVKKGYLIKSTKEGIRSCVYDLTPKGKEFCESKFNSKE